MESSGEKKNFFHSFRVFNQCSEYGVSVWQCPQFLFVIMGTVIIASILLTNFVARRYLDPEIVALIVLGVTGVLFVVSYAIVSSFERVAESSRSKSEFVSIMSYRLRAPLSGIKWKLDLLMSQKFGGEKMENPDVLGDIRNYNEKMISLVNDLLDLNRIEDGTLKLAPSAFPLQAVLEEAADILKADADKAGIKIILTLPDPLNIVFADRGRVKNIILHMLDNAVRYSTHPGAVKASLELWENGKFVRFAVRDEGVGIPSEDQAKVFGKFFRVKNNLQYQTEGTGVGLYLAKKVVEMSGGEIGFSSVEGKGSVFWVTLPIA